MKKNLSPFMVFALVSFGFLGAGPHRVAWCGEERHRSVVGLEDLGAGDLPVTDNVPGEVWGRLESAGYPPNEHASPESGAGGSLKTIVMDGASVQFTVVSNAPLQAVRDLKTLLAAIAFVPYVPDTNNTIFVDRFGDLAFFSGTGLPPIAVRMTGNEGHIDRIKVAKGCDGVALLPGGVAGGIERIQVGILPLFVLRKDPGGFGMLERRRPFPQKEMLIAWDASLQQLPTLPFDEVGTKDGRFWIQRNVDAFQVPANSEGPWFATSWHCPHYVYQFSLLDPVSRNPNVVIMRLFFEHDNNGFHPVEVSVDMVNAAQFRGPSTACQRFLTKDEILGARFGRYRGEDRTNPDESGTGQQYLDISMAFSLEYLAELRTAFEDRHKKEISLTSSVARAFQALGQTRTCSLTGDERTVEIGGISPTVYFDALR
jgi:hypothetical protein